MSSLLFWGCQRPISTITALNGTQTIPETFESPVMKTPSSQDDGFVKPIPLAKADKVAPPPTLKPNYPILRLPEASKFIINAEWVMVNEGKKIGTPCNMYLRRVLEVSGYPSQSFLATDFDLYAKRNMKQATIVNFLNDGQGSEIERLKRHLWSYPERTPFILQWSRAEVIGHVAILERVDQTLIIYQASLNKYSARKDKTTVSGLLLGRNRRTLTVYSNF